MPHFGSRVIGNEAYDKAVREEKGGAHVFGVRVTGAITGNGPVAEAKRNTEHGPLVVAGAQQTDTKGEPGEGVSIEELRNVLAENPTFLDSLYEAELAREDGPRPDALGIIREVEKGIKGAGRREVLDEIASLLGEKEVTAAQRADLNKGFLVAHEAQMQRMEENKLLDDAPRVKALRERQENIDAVRAAGGDVAPGVSTTAPDTLAQAREAAGLNTPEGADADKPEVPAKPDAEETHAESQSRAPRKPSTLKRK
jgi:hypothetical protein